MRPGGWHRAAGDLLQHHSWEDFSVLFLFFFIFRSFSLSLSLSLWTRPQAARIRRGGNKRHPRPDRRSRRDRWGGPALQYGSATRCAVVLKQEYYGCRSIVVAQ